MPAARAAATAARMSGSSDGSIRNPWTQIWAPTPWSAARRPTSSENRVTNGPAGSPKAFQ